MLILTICTGNVCRSPALQMMLNEGCSGPGWPDLGLKVVSAGTAALVGHSLDSRMRDAMSDLGFSPEEGFSATQLTSDMVDSADLVLTATVDLRAQVFRAVPRALRRTFTARELSERSRARLFEGATASERLCSLIDYAASNRDASQFRRTSEADIVDPYRRPPRVYRRSALQLLGVATSLTYAIAGDGVYK